MGQSDGPSVRPRFGGLVVIDREGMLPLFWVSLGLMEECSQSGLSYRSLVSVSRRRRWSVGGRGGIVASRTRRQLIGSLAELSRVSRCVDQ